MCICNWSKPSLSVLWSDKWQKPEKMAATSGNGVNKQKWWKCTEKSGFNTHLYNWSIKIWFQYTSYTLPWCITCVYWPTSCHFPQNLYLGKSLVKLRSHGPWQISSDNVTISMPVVQSCLSNFHFTSTSVNFHFSGRSLLARTDLQTPSPNEKSATKSGAFVRLQGQMGRHEKLT